MYSISEHVITITLTYTLYLFENMNNFLLKYMLDFHSLATLEKNKNI